MTGPHPARHVPERTCVACRRKRPQPEFVRLTRVDGAWTVCPGPRQGRGAYLCADRPECWQDKRLRRVFGAQAAAVSALRPGTAQTGTDPIHNA
ncbi:YlxR family protein [Deinococcus multiflagellatus]|uniref:YlxR family protein n=1 Tax=Deinococcus multiflagellatus TaxID=1656887 RepID=A0ABW1ZGR8_9DEIO|nr:YlxR family protein [Deinococcus multiflagellatus]MBZ9711859.1 YlxR family protein [Deinococcus multiflagellatus]